MSEYMQRTGENENVWMRCSACNKPAMMEYWEWHDMPADLLGCPHCGKEVPIGEWHKESPPVEPTQSCLMCGGTGELSGEQQ